MSTVEKFNVGGVLLNQPFKIRRLGHFGFNLVEHGRRHAISTVTCSVSVFPTSWITRGAPKIPRKSPASAITNGYFTRYGNDHHAMVLFLTSVRGCLGAPGATRHHREPDYLASGQSERSRQWHQLV